MARCKISCKKDGMMFKLNSSSSDYMFQSQLSLLSLDKVRELDFVPARLHLDGNGEVQAMNRPTRSKNEQFDLRLLHHIKSMGSLEHVSRLDILFNDCWTQQWHKTLQMFPRLAELGITLLKPTSTSNWYISETYLRLLQRIVAASRAPVLKLYVVKGFKQRGVKVLISNFVEKLVV